MEHFFEIPGLIHIGEYILMLLDHDSILNFQCVCKLWNEFLDNNSKFWLKKCVQKHIPGHIYIQWKELILHTKDDILGTIHKLR